MQEAPAFGLGLAAMPLVVAYQFLVLDLVYFGNPLGGLIVPVYFLGGAGFIFTVGYVGRILSRARRKAFLWISVPVWVATGAFLFTMILLPG